MKITQVFAEKWLITFSKKCASSLSVNKNLLKIELFEKITHQKVGGFFLIFEEIKTQNPNLTTTFEVNICFF